MVLRFTVQTGARRRLETVTAAPTGRNFIHVEVTAMTVLDQRCSLFIASTLVVRRKPHATANVGFVLSYITQQQDKLNTFVLVFPKEITDEGFVTLFKMQSASNHFMPCYLIDISKSRAKF
jgi:hypothetical protein